MLGDDTLELLSNVYIGYALLFEGQHELARSVIAAQTKLAQKRGEKRQLQIVEAARLQLQRWDEEQEKKRQNWNFNLLFFSSQNKMDLSSKKNFRT